MIKAGYTFEAWLTLRAKTYLYAIAAKRLASSSMTFLLNSKLVTKSFGTPFEFGYYYSHKVEFRRFLKVVIINIRKKLPMIKSGNANYVTPFIQVRNRYSSLDLYLERIQLPVGVANPVNGVITKRAKIGKEVIERYFRYIGVYNYLSIHGIPLTLDITAETLGVPYEIHASGVVFITHIRIQTNDSGRTGTVWAYYPLYLVILRTQTILKILSTLHRKALFRQEQLNAAPATSRDDDPSVDYTENPF
jgi:hypothetical protein